MMEDLIYFSIVAGFLGVYAFMAILCAKAEMLIHHLGGIREEVQYQRFMMEHEIKRKQREQEINE